MSGITDMIDGRIARKTNTESKVGAMLDSVADALFLAVVWIKLIPVIIKVLPGWVLWASIIIAGIRFLTYAIGALKYHKLAALHTIMNKITGAALFGVPYYVFVFDVGVVSFVLCEIAGISAIEELMITIKSNCFEPDVRSILEA